MMNILILEGYLKQIGENANECEDELSDDDLDMIECNSLKPSGNIQEENSKNEELWKRGQ